MRVDPGASHAAEARRAVGGFGALATLDGAGLPGPARLDGYDASDDVVVAVRVSYGDLAADGPWTCVETARYGGGRMLPLPLREVVEHHVRLDGVRFADLEWSAGSGSVTLDGE
ncbi:hypothetical protein [Asanoa iriomotensis]|uniref:Uncharacterized protein n=1 Tax=Asanoa iriomotensis TaxID=234613 RepID=A0ABQ4BXH1_9ACTN|nr:hypothetical protein [Asanoa iriomotensis]GIF54866.1 hypothetical protein Air01nite_09610 [Asanoa iriomotensis]